MENGNGKYLGIVGKSKIKHRSIVDRYLRILYFVEYDDVMMMCGCGVGGMPSVHHPKDPRPNSSNFHFQLPTSYSTSCMPSFRATHDLLPLDLECSTSFMVLRRIAQISSIVEVEEGYDAPRRCSVPLIQTNRIACMGCGGSLLLLLTVVHS